MQKKYIDVDVLRAEIKERICKNTTKNAFPKGALCAARISAYNEILALLDSYEESGKCDVSNECV